MKRRTILLFIAIFPILILISCLSSKNMAATLAYETKADWTNPPTYSPYPTYTVQPASTKEVTRIVVVTKTQVPTPTKTDWRDPTVQYTPLPTVDLSDVPPEIIKRASVAGMKPNEVVYLFNMIQRVAKDRDPVPLLDFLRFPLKEWTKCPGDVIETQEEFILRFPSIMTESARANILKLKMEDIFLSWRGMALAANTPFDIWFLAYCTDGNCTTHFIVLEVFIKYSIFWEMVEGSPVSTSS
jgi:hypothetical protein